MSKVVLDVSTSLDGFVAAPNSTLEEPLGGAASSSTSGSRSSSARHDVHVRDRRGRGGDPTRARGGGGQDVYVAGGAQAATETLNAGLLHEILLHVAPVLLGGGTRFFEGAAPGRAARARSGARVTHGDHLRYRVFR